VSARLQTAAQLAVCLQLSSMQAIALPGWSVDLGLAAVHLDGGSQPSPAFGQQLCNPQAESVLLAAGISVSTSEGGSAWRLSSIALAMQPADTAAVAALVESTGGQAALPPQPSYPAYLGAQAQASNAGPADALSVELDTICLTIYPLQGGSAAEPVGLTGWLEGVKWTECATSRQLLAVGSLQLGLCRTGNPGAATSSPANMRMASAVRYDFCLL
jgi:hypothetical protein